MPKVGSKRFAYTKKGVDAAEKEAAETGMAMKMMHGPRGHAGRKPPRGGKKKGR